MNSCVELALGTVQFGMPYGIAGRTELMPLSEISNILSAAKKVGVSLLDTAPAYGLAEKNLSQCLSHTSFKVISKIPSLPENADEKIIEHNIRASIRQTCHYLNDSLKGFLFHSSKDLLSDHGDFIWEIASSEIVNTKIVLGVSCYSPDDLVTLSTRYPIAVAQLPGNALDQRIHRLGIDSSIELHLRSIFLQGLLLMSQQEVAAKLPHAITAHDKWSQWCQERELTKLSAAIGIAKGFQSARCCVVGVDSLMQLEEITSIWNTVEPIYAPELEVDNQAVIDPRYWVN